MERGNHTMDADHIIEKHMNELRSEVSGLIASYDQEHAQKVTELQEQLLNSQKDAFELVDKLKTELQRRYDNVQTGEKRVFCVIDGDGCIFARPRLQEGGPGGRGAAQALTNIIRQRFPLEQIHVWVFLNKRGLVQTLNRCNEPDVAQGLEGFIYGFNQASERFIMVDVGDGKELVDSKVKACLVDQIKLPQTLKVIFGGCHDNGYLTTIHSLITEGYGKKLDLLPGYAEMTAGFKSLGLPSLVVPSDLFEQDKLSIPTQGGSRSTVNPVLAQSPSPTPSSPQSSSVKRVSPSSWAELLGGRNPLPIKQTTNTQANGRSIDPVKPLHRQEPPLCNLYYLATCKSDSSCNYSHDYNLTPEQFEALRQFVKKLPCTYMNHYGACALGDSCCYGHKCPYLTKCHYLKTGTCKFIGAGMHAE